MKVKVCRRCLNWVPKDIVKPVKWNLKLINKLNKSKTYPSLHFQYQLHLNSSPIIFKIKKKKCMIEKNRLIGGKKSTNKQQHTQNKKTNNKRPKDKRAYHNTNALNQQRSFKKKSINLTIQCADRQLIPQERSSKVKGSAAILDLDTLGTRSLTAVW